jgi:ferritin-like metal-binding protein YciE
MTKHLNSLESLFIDELKDLYDAEKRMVAALPDMAEAANSDDLKRGFRLHLDQTREHVSRIEEVFEQLEADPRGRKCVGMEGIIQEGKQLMRQGDSDPDVLDAALIATAQKAEHYEIASYGTVRKFAEHLGYDHLARKLSRTLDEESKINERFTSMAVGHINMKAMQVS